MQNIKQFFKIQHVFTGNFSQIKPSMNLSTAFFGIKMISKHSPNQVMNMSLFTLLLGYLFTFFDNQINGVTFILQRIFGVILLYKSRSTNPTLQEVIWNFQAICIYRRFVIDTMGLKKTLTTLIFTVYDINIAIEKRFPGQVYFWQILFIVLSGVMLY